MGGRTTWNLNLRMSFVFLVHCARYIVKANDFSLRRTFFFFPVPIMHSRGRGGQKLKQIHRIAG